MLKNKINTIFLLLILPLLISCKQNDNLNELKTQVTNTVNTPDTILFYNKPNENFEYAKFNSNNDELNFRFLFPTDFDSSKRYPLLLFFHGAGERGDDNELQLTHLKNFLENNNSDYSFFAIVPQCPANTKWVDADWTEESSKFSQVPLKPMLLSIKLLDYVTKNYNTDTNRYYTIGVSMGGFAVWDIITRLPGKFAAAVPICGGGDENETNKIGDIPLWVFHGAKDKLVKTSRSRNMVNALKENKNLIYDEPSSYGHNVWEYAFNKPELYKWLFEQTKSEK